MNYAQAIVTDADTHIFEGHAAQHRKSFDRDC